MLTSKQSLAARINRKYSLAQIIAMFWSHQDFLFVLILTNTFCGINNTCASIFHSGLPHVVLIWTLQYIKLNVWVFHWWMIINHKKTAQRMDRRYLSPSFSSFNLCEGSWKQVDERVTLWWDKFSVTLMNVNFHIKQHVLNSSFGATNTKQRKVERK